jgi:hypothetical protein
MHSSSSIDSSERSKLSKAIAIVPQIQNKPEHPQRAVHQINLSAIRHNYHIISAAANRQKCSVIVVVKADGYGRECLYLVSLFRFWVSVVPNHCSTLFQTHIHIVYTRWCN